MSFKKRATGENTNMEGIKEREMGKPVPPVPGCQATNPDWRHLPRNRPDKDEKHLAYSILIANGVQKDKAATMLGYSAKTVRSIDRALVKKGLKLELLSEQRIKKAHRVIDKCLAGKPFGGVETIKDSTALRAAEAILDRSDPKTQAVAPPSHSYVNVDLSIFLPDPPPEPKTIDLETGPATTTTERP
jgi:hypothetical protein